MGRRGILLTTAAAALWAGQAAAQATSATPPGGVTANGTAATAERATEAARKGGAVVEELVVTARQHGVDELRDSPVAVTTFNAEQRNLVAANTITDLVNLTPGVTISEKGMNMRGVGRQTNETATLGSTPGIAYYVNGFYNVVASNVGESTLYSESVQFERGPQGTRYGRETIGGTASLWARHPTAEFRGEAVAQYGSNGFWGAGLNVAGPVNDRWGVRFGYQHFDADRSVQHNIFPGVTAGLRSTNNYFEFQIEGHPSDNFHVWLRSTTFNYTSDPGYGAPPVYNTTASMGSLVPNPTFGYTTPPPRGRNINVDTKGIDRLRDNMVHILNADYDFGGAKLSYVGGYAQYKANGNSDFDAAGRVSYTVCAPSATVICAPGATAPFPGLANGRVVSTRQVADYLNRVHYFTHEFRLENTTKSRVDWVIGAFYYNHVFNYFFEETEPDEPQLSNPIASFATFAAAAANPSRSFYQQHNVFRVNSLAGFGDLVFHATPNLDVYGGLRYSVERGHAMTSVRYTFFNPAFGRSLDVTPGTPGGAAGVNGANLTYDDRAWTGRLGVDEHLSDDALLYAKYSRGFKPSAFNVDNVTSVANNFAAPEKLDAYEAGWKQRFGRRLSADATVFYYDYRNLQIPLTVINPVTHNPGSAYTNFSKARTYGLELQATWTPVQALWINANYSYLNAKTVSFCCGVDPFNPATAAGVSLNGKTLPRSPQNKASVSGAYSWNFTPGSVILGGSVVHQSEQQQDAFDNPLFRIPATTLVNASLTFRSADNHYDLILQGSNLFDKLYATNIAAAANGAGGVTTSPTYGGPRFVQVELRYRW